MLHFWITWVSGNPIIVDSGSQPFYHSNTHATALNIVLNSTSTVPNVLGWSRAYAEDAITGAGLTPDVHESTSLRPAGTVLDENSGPGTVEPSGSSVILLVAHNDPLGLVYQSDINTKVNTAKSLQVGVTGGALPYTFAVSGLPPGVSYQGLPSTSGLAISGTPTAVGTFPVTYSVTDGNGQTVTHSFTWTVAQLETRNFSGYGDAGSRATAVAFADDDAIQNAANAGFDGCTTISQSVARDGNVYDASVTKSCTG